jgi:hypothetical protein
MPGDDKVTQLGRLLGRAGRGHHLEVGGPSPVWPEWYAAHVHPEIAQYLGYEPTVEEVADWLREADERHRAEAPDQSWPQFYARLFLESHSAPESPAEARDGSGPNSRGPSGPTTSPS